MKKYLLLLALLVAAVYAPAVGNGFVWDDTALILRDPFIRSWRLIPEGFGHFLFTDATASDFYRPMQRLSYTLEYAAFGFRPAPYHVINILLHLAAAGALFAFARELLRSLGASERLRSWVPLVAAAVWAIHPVQSAAVVYISGRADALAALFGFTALSFALVSQRLERGRKWGALAGATVLFLLAALSKEAGLIFPALWLIILVVERKWSWPVLAVIALVFVGYLSLRVPAEHIAPPPRPALPLLVRPVLAARAVAEYAGLLAFPLHLRMERTVETQPSGFGNASMTGAAWRELQTLAGVLLVLAFGWWIWRARTGDRAVYLSLLLTVCSYLPVSGVLPLNATVAEHWLYLPSAFLFLAIGLRVARFRFAARWLVPALALWMAFLGGRTFLRTFDWKDQRTFLERTLAQGGDSARMLINLAGLEMNEHHFAEAKAHLRRALEKEPEQPLALLNLAAVALKENDFAAAHQWLDRALPLPQVEAQAQEMLTVLEHKENGQIDLRRLRLAARTGPPNWAIEQRFVRLLAETGAPEAAIAELQHCLESQWYRAESWQLLSELAQAHGREALAAEALAHARAYDVRLGESRAAL